MKHHNFEVSIIPKGHYRCITVMNYMKDHEGIGKAFSDHISSPDIDQNGYLRLKVGSM